MAPPIIEFKHDGLVLDACCAINLCVSGQMESILRIIPVRVAIAEYVAEVEVRECNLRPFISNELLTVIEVVTEEEAENVVTFATALGGDGEAYTGAIAVSHNLAIASDERRVLNYFERQAPHLQRLTSPELVKFWSDTANPPSHAVSQALQAIEQVGNYAVPNRSNCYDWWMAHR
ncbi:MAG: hypothetical protein ABJA67_06670 [Chthonomonadales bacterium]